MSGAIPITLTLPNDSAALLVNKLIELGITGTQRLTENGVRVSINRTKDNRDQVSEVIKYIKQLKKK